MSQMLTTPGTLKIVPHANDDGIIDGMIVSPPKTFTDAQYFKILFDWPDLVCIVCHNGMTDRNYSGFEMTMDGWACKSHNYKTKKALPPS